MADRPTFDARKKLADALAKSGLAVPEVARQLRPGAVCSLVDDAISFPTDRIADAGERTKHPRRRVIVVQCREWAIARSPPTLVVVPCSASHRGTVGAWDVEIPDTEPAFTKERVVAYTSLLQPVLKSDVGQIHGHLSEETSQILLRRLAQLLDLASMG